MQSISSAIDSVFGVFDKISDRIEQYADSKRKSTSERTRDWELAAGLDNAPWPIYTARTIAETQKPVEISLVLPECTNPFIAGRGTILNDFDAGNDVYYPLTPQFVENFEPFKALAEKFKASGLNLTVKETDSPTMGVRRYPAEVVLLASASTVSPVAP